MKSTLSGLALLLMLLFSSPPESLNSSPPPAGRGDPSDPFVIKISNAPRAARILANPTSEDTPLTVTSVAFSFSDNFNRPNTTQLGPDWNEYQTNLEIFNGRVRNTNTGSKAAQFARAIGPDQDVSVDCMMTVTRNNCAVMARWSNASNFYRARLDVGAQDFKIFKTVNEITTLLGTARRSLQFNTLYRIRLVVRGSSLQAFFGNETTPAISVTDSFLTAGNFAGIRSFTSASSTVWFDNFSVTTPSGPSPISCSSTRRDPYIAFVTTDAAVIAWQCTRQATIRWGVAPNIDQSADATANTDHHKFNIVPLSPQTTYAYQVEVSGSVLGAGTFTTAPTRAENRFTFAAFADAGDGSANQRAVANLLAGSDIDFAVIAGDVVYDRGADSEFDPRYFAPYRGIINRTPFFPVVGNHDIVADGGATFMKNFHHPEGTFYFDFQWGDTHFIALDSNRPTDAAQRSWLSSTLAASTARWKIVYFHHPPFSSGGFQGSNLGVRSNWVPLFEQHHVDLVISGHEHSYERTIPINGVTYLVTGGGGAPLLPVGRSSFTAFSRSIHHATFITMTPTTLTIAATDPNGVVLDSHTITKGGNQPPTARMTANPTSGPAPLPVHFDGSTSFDPDGTIASYAWDFGDGTDGTGSIVDHSYASPGTFNATLIVTDQEGAATSAQTTIIVGSGTNLLFNDEFNRTTGLGSSWKITAGSFGTDGNFAISGGSANAAAITQSFGTSDYTVETAMIIPTGSQFSGIIARGRTDASFTLDLYSAQLHTNGTVNLYRRNAGSWTLLRSAPAGIVANRAFTLGLKVTGSNPVNLEVFLDGNPLFTVTDSSPSRITSGIPGLINYDPNVRYDRFSVFTP
jgi:PKD repeat protein/predicted phosphodiesterase